MPKSISLRPALLALVSVVIGLSLAASAPVARSQAAPFEGGEVLNDPEWRKSFLGSYGFLSGAEPQINPSELEVLREVIDVMKVNVDAAASMLSQRATPDRSAAFDFILANLQFQNGKLDEAVTAYEAAISKFPDFRRAHKNLGLLRTQKGEYAKAAHHLSRAVELGDRDGKNYGLLGFAYLNLENHLAAEQAYRNAILAQPDIRDWKLGLGRALLAIEKQKEAAALFGGLLQQNPEDASAWLLQANAFLKLDQPLAAAVNLESVRMLGKADKNSLVLLGDIYMNAQMPDLAKSAYLEVIESDGGAEDFPSAHRAAELLVRTQSFEQASELLAAIEKKYADELVLDEELEILTLKAKIARASGKEKQAARILESVVERDGTRGDALLELARYHNGRGDRAKALLMIERAQKLEAFEYKALLEHAQIMVASRKYPEAAESLRAAQDIKREPRVARFLAQVEQAIVPR